MKKLFILATAAVALASCSDSDLVGNIASSQQTEQPQAVEFGTYMGTAATRAYGDGNYTGGQITNADYSTTTGSHSIKNAQFGVFAYHTGATDFDSWTKVAPNFMYNQQITWNTSGYWTYTPVKYWPNGYDKGNGTTGPSNTAEESGIQKVSFFAYAPFTTVTGTAYSGEDKPTSPTVTNAVTTNNTTGIVAMSRNDETTDMQVKYTFGTTAGASSASENNAVDLLWGLRGAQAYTESDGGNNTIASLGTTYNKDLTKQTVDERVKFLFKHALARIGGSTSSTAAASDKQICGLKVVLDVDDNSTTALNGSDNQSYYLGSSFDQTQTLVTISDVKIQDKYTYTASTTSTEDDAASDFATDGWFDIMTGTWTKTASNTNLSANPKVVGATYDIQATTSGTYKLNPDIAEPASVASSNVSASGKWTGLTPTGVTTTVKNVYDNQDIPGLLLIPTSNNSDNNTLYVTVTYKVRTADNNLSTKFSEITQTIVNKVTLTGDLLNSNKYYTLVMHLGLTSVKFEAVVADWSYSGSGTYNEDGSENPSGTEAATSVWLPSNVVNGVLATTLSSDDPVPAAGGASNTRTINKTATQAGTSITPAGTFTYTSSNTDVATVTDAGVVTFTANTTTSRRTATITITYNNTDYNISPAYVTITQEPAVVTVAAAASGTVGSPVTLTVTNTTLDPAVAIAYPNYSFAVYTNADCTTAATAGAYTNNGDGTVTFNTAGTYYIKATSGDSTAKSSAITVSAGS